MKQVLGLTFLVAFLGGWVGPYLLAGFVTIHSFELAGYRLLCAFLGALLGAGLGFACKGKKLW